MTVSSNYESLNLIDERLAQAHAMLVAMNGPEGLPPLSKELISNYVWTMQVLIEQAQSALKVAFAPGSVEPVSPKGNNGHRDGADEHLTKLAVGVDAILTPARRALEHGGQQMDEESRMTLESVIADLSQSVAVVPEFFRSRVNNPH